MNVTKTSKAAFIRELCADGAEWVYWGWSRTDSYDLQYYAERAIKVAEDIRDNGIICEHRTYKHTSGNRVVSHTGSVLDLNKNDTVYSFDYGFIVENSYNRWTYIRG